MLRFYFQRQEAEHQAAERMSRIAHGANRCIEEVRFHYQHNQMTPQQLKNEEDAAGDRLVADIEEKYRRGQATREALDFMKKIMAESKANETPTMYCEDPPEANTSWTFEHTTDGQITITAEGSKHWRRATLEDCGSIVLVGDYYRQKDGSLFVFGELDDFDEQPDEEFPDESHMVAIVYTQDGNQHLSHSWTDGNFEALWVVPDQVLEGRRNEAPPGSFFTGISITNSNTWSPTPEGMVWFDHPLSIPNVKLVTDFEYFFLKRTLELYPGILRDIEQAMDRYETMGRFAFWCPVLRRFMCEGEMMRQEHWFCNGDGSAQQRRYYSQNEMLYQYGGLSTLPLGFHDDGLPKTADDDDVKVAAVRTVDCSVAEKFKAAVESGSMIDLS